MPAPPPGGDAHRIHSAPKEQAARLSRFTKQETAVGSEALRSVQKHLHFRRLQTGQTVERVMHHRLEMIPVLGKQLESEIMTNPFRIDRFAHRLETADEQAAGVIADVEMTVMIRQCRQIAADAVPPAWSEDRNARTARPALRSRPSPRLHGSTGRCTARSHRIHRTAVGLDAGDPVAFGQNSGPAVSSKMRAPADRAPLDQRRAEIRRADAPIIR
jgi:hypothetical protein